MPVLWTKMSVVRDKRHCFTVSAVKVGDSMRSAVVDIVDPPSEIGNFATFKEDINIGKLLASHDTAIMLALPGAYNPLCTARHIPGYIRLADTFREEHGVEATYCLAVNDKYVSS